MGLLAHAYAVTNAFGRKGAITRGPKVPQVALTFDDGPDPRFTEEICAILEAYEAQASFFMIGDHVKKHPELARRVAEAGHEPCAHLYSHDPEVVNELEHFRRELRDCLRIIRETTDEWPLFLRFPFAFQGRLKPKRIVASHGVHTVHWSFSSHDSRLDAAGIVKRVGRFIFPGAIVLLHDGVGRHSTKAVDRRATVAALPGVLDACRAAGLAPVTLSRLFNVRGR
jgi:peptidoglycan/xylan/chitin deacetylase (PgdA/CDA1 family)